MKVFYIGYGSQRGAIVSWIKEMLRYTNFDFNGVLISKRKELFLNFDHVPTTPIITSSIIKSKIFSSNPEIIHFINQLALYFISEKDLKELKRNAKIVVTIHDVDLFRVGRFSKYGKNSLDRLKCLLGISYFDIGLNIIRKLKYVDVIVCDSQDAYNSLNEYLCLSGLIDAIKRTRVVYLGYNNEIFTKLNEDKKILRQHLRIPANKKILLHISGGPVPRKNVLTILKVLKSLPEEYILVKTGRFHQVEEEYIIKNKLTHRVFNLGRIDLKKLVLLYNSSDIFLFPSVFEGFGLPVLEAMACGIPTIISNTIASTEFMTIKELQFDPWDVEGMTQKILELMNNKRKYDKISNRLIQISKNYTWEKTAKEYLKIYEGVL